jgi:hypothetical protein
MEWLHHFLRQDIAQRHIAPAFGLVANPVLFAQTFY